MNEYPALIISKNLVPLYKKFSEAGIIVNVVMSVSELREFLLKYSKVITNIPIVLSDLARFGNYQARLLKFVEEAKSPIIILSSEDCVSSVLMSRFMSVLKEPKIVVNESDKPYLMVESFSKSEGSMSLEDMIKYAPSVYQMSEYIQMSNLVSKDKIRQLVFT